MTKEKKNIHQRLRDIMLDVKAINKEKKKVNGQYSFVSHDSVAKALHDPLANHGVVMIPTVDELTQTGNRTVAKVEVSFVNIDDPKDFVSVVYYGYGVDNQDKGVGKAISYAVKYCLLKVFCLETGDDVETDKIEYDPLEEKKSKSPKISRGQYEKLEDALDDNVDLRMRILSRLRSKHKITSLQDITQELYPAIIQAALAAKEDQQQAIGE